MHSRPTHSGVDLGTAPAVLLLDGFERITLIGHSFGGALELNPAEDLGADFTVVHGRNHHPVDHDWIHRHPSLLLHHLERLRVRAVMTVS